MGRAFSSRNYRLYFLGQGVSLIGTWMQQIALSWLVYRLTKSPFLLGLVAFASQVPTMLLIPITGVFADRWNRYRAMIVIQLLEMLLALTLGILVLGHWIRISHIFILGIILGVLMAADSPTRHAFLVQLVDRRKDLPNAIAMSSAMFNSARLIGPSIAGLVIAWVGEGICFLLNSVSFLAIIFALLAMRLPPQPSKKALSSGIFSEFREGFAYTFRIKPLRLLILHFAWVSFTSMSFTVLLPVLVKETLGGGAHTLGFLMGGLGTGALISALALAGRRHTADYWKLSGWSSTCFGVSLLLLSFSRNHSIAVLIMAGAGLGMITQMTTTNTFLQTYVSDSMRARVLSFYLFAFFGTVPVGYLIMGTAAKWIGAPLTIRYAGVLALVGSWVYLLAFSCLRQKIPDIPPEPSSLDPII